MDRFLQRYSSFARILTSSTLRCFGTLISLHQCAGVVDESIIRKAKWMLLIPLVSYSFVWILLRALQWNIQAASISSLSLFATVGALHAFIPDLVTRIMGQVVAVLFISLLNLVKHMESLGQAILILVVLDATTYKTSRPKNLKVPIVTLALLLIIILPFRGGISMYRNSITKSGLAEQRMESALTNYDDGAKCDQRYNSTFVFAFERASQNETFAKMYAYDALEDLVVTNRPSIEDFFGMIASHFLHVNLGHLLSNALGLGVLGVMFEHIYSRRFLIVAVLTALALGIVVDIIVPQTISPRSLLYVTVATLDDIVRLWILRNSESFVGDIYFGS